MYKSLFVTMAWLKKSGEWMSFSRMLLIFIFILIFLIIIFSFFFKPLLGPKRFRFSFLCSHLIFLTIIAILVWISRDVAQSELYWIFPGIIDLPVSTLALLCRKIFPGITNNFTFLFIFFMLFGNLQYYFLGYCVDLLFQKLGWIK